MLEKPLPLSEWLAAVLIFLLPLLIPIISYLASTGASIPGWLDTFIYVQIWLFMAWTCLALGAWLYLRAREQKGRILSLLGGASGALWIVALAKWVLIPLQKWPDGYPVAPSPVTRLVETGGALTGWVLILLLLLAPALLNLLPTSPAQNVHGEFNSRNLT